MRERPQFFIDLERELAGLEPEAAPEQEPLLAIPVTLTRNGPTLAEIAQAMSVGLNCETATGAMIAAQQQREQMSALVYEQLRQSVTRGLYGQGVSSQGGSVLDSLGMFKSLFGPLR